VSVEANNAPAPIMRRHPFKEGMLLAIAESGTCSGVTSVVHTVPCQMSSSFAVLQSRLANPLLSERAPVTSLSPATILVVDDDAAIREIIVETLSDEGYTILQASDGARALDILRRSAEPLVVLLDLMMPGMSGKDVLQAVAADRRLATTHAYVLITAAEHNLPLPLVHLLTVLEVPILPKPFDLRALLYRVEHALRRMAPREVTRAEYDEYEYEYELSS